MVEFNTKPWLSHHEEASISVFKRVVYCIIRPLLSFHYSRYLSQETIQELQPNLCLGSRGMPLETRRRWGIKYIKEIQDSLLLVQGTGTGWDVISWAKLRPRKIIATDMFSFEDSWEEITRYCNDRYDVPVEFRVAPNEDLSFLASDSIDFIASDAVYEHCRNLPGVMTESFRIMKPSGYLYASYGPLYFCAGGDHFSGRGGLKTCFNHLLLDSKSYQQYVKEHQQEIEDYQGGARYINLKLFSYCTTSQYINIFQKAGFVVKEIILEISPDALQYKKIYPDTFKLLVKKLKEKCLPDDLLLKANLIILQKIDN